MIKGHYIVCIESERDFVRARRRERQSCTHMEGVVSTVFRTWRVLAGGQEAAMEWPREEGHPGVVVGKNDDLTSYDGIRAPELSPTASSEESMGVLKGRDPCQVLLVYCDASGGGCTDRWIAMHA